MIFILLILLLVLPVDTLPLTITASFFNQNHSAQNPLILTEDTQIEMNEDISIDTKEPLFELQNPTKPIKLTFIQNGMKIFRVIIQRDAVLNLKSFTKSNQAITFENTDLNTRNKSTILLQGAHLVFTGGTIVLSD